MRRILTFPGGSPHRAAACSTGRRPGGQRSGRHGAAHGVGAFVLGADEAATIERFAAEVVPTREMVAAEQEAAAAA